MNHTFLTKGNFLIFYLFKELTK